MMRHRLSGFTLIEVLVFIVVSSLLMTVILLGGVTALRASPTVQQQWVAIQTARLCTEYFLDQRRVNGYASLTCPSTPACVAPDGFSVAVSVTCSTWNSDTTYKTITTTVTGDARAVLSVQVGNY